MARESTNVEYLALEELDRDEDKLDALFDENAFAALGTSDSLVEELFEDGIVAIWLLHLTWGCLVL